MFKSKLLGSFCKQIVPLLTEHDDVFETQTKNCMRSQIAAGTTADKLVIPIFLLAGSILSRNHGLAMLVHDRMEWPLVDQSPKQSETEWLCVDVA